MSLIELREGLKQLVAEKLRRDEERERAEAKAAKRRAEEEHDGEGGAVVGEHEEGGIVARIESDGMTSEEKADEARKKARQLEWSEADLSNLMRCARIANGLALSGDQAVRRCPRLSPSSPRYMDPDGDGDLSVDELEDSMTRAAQTPRALAVERQAGAVIARLEDEMNRRNMRIRDLFAQVDADHSGVISPDELRDGLDKMCGPSAFERAKAKKAQELLRAQQKEERERLVREAKLAKRLEAAKASGAHRVLMRLEKHMQQKKARVGDLFSKSGFDASGDGKLDATELGGALAQLDIAMAPDELATLVAFLDDSGDGEIEAWELEAALRQLKRDMADEQTANKAAAARARAADGGGAPSPDKKDVVVNHAAAAAAAAMAERAAAERAAVAPGNDTEVDMEGSHQLYRLRKKHEIWCGGELDSSWLSSFDERFRGFKRKLA